jgi:endonuclease YncB( thermonuclease family)
MSGWRGRFLAVTCAAEFAIMGGCFCAPAQERPLPSSACNGETIARGTVSHSVDGRTFMLDDGREVRLAAIEVPPLPSPQEAGAVPGGTAARDALAALLAGAEIELRQAESEKTDRYGRIVAFAFARRDGAERPVQADLIAAGFARVAARAGDHACAAELLRREDAARRAKLGLWANSYYDSLDADNPADVLAELGHFALVEGKGCFGARKRRHHLREFRAAVEHGLHRYDPEAKCA